MNLARLLLYAERKRRNEMFDKSSKIEYMFSANKMKTWIIASKAITIVWLKLCCCHAMKIRIRIQCVGILSFMLSDSTCNVSVCVCVLLLLPVAVKFFSMKIILHVQ